VPPAGGQGAAYDELAAYADGLGFRVEVGELPGETNGPLRSPDQRSRSAKV
jgi:hypothetical protein